MGRGLFLEKYIYHMDDCKIWFWFAASFEVITDKRFGVLAIWITPCISIRLLAFLCSTSYYFISNILTKHMEWTLKVLPWFPWRRFFITKKKSIGFTRLLWQGLEFLISEIIIKLIGRKLWWICLHLLRRLLLLLRRIYSHAPTTRCVFVITMSNAGICFISFCCSSSCLIR